MSKIAQAYYEFNYEANMQMKNEYEQLIIEINDLEKKFQTIADGINEDWNCYITLDTFEFEEENEYDYRYSEIRNIYNQINKLKEERDNLKNELKHAKVL